MKHTVQRGDSLWAISRKYGISVDQIRKLNNLSSDALNLGQQIVVSASAPTSNPSGNIGAAEQLDVSLPSAQPSSSIGQPSAKELENIKRHRDAVFKMTTAPEGAGKRYNVSFADYKGTTQNVSFKSGVKSRFAVYDQGVSYAGKVIHNIPMSYYQSLGLTPSLSKALEFVSKNEGNFDAINSYDKAFFSFGFVQFAGGGRSLHTLLALMKYRNPDAFYDAFERFGINVEYTFANNRFANQKTVVIVPEGVGGRHVLRGDDAEIHLRENKLLHAVFIRAGYDPEIAKLQVMMAVYEYANPAFRRKIKVGGTEARTVEFVKSEAGLTALIDMSVNKGVGGASRLFQAAIEGSGKEQGLSGSSLKNINERKMMEYMIRTNSDSRVKKRVQKAIDNLSC